MSIDLKVSIEIFGKQQLAGFIKGTDSDNASFCYAEEYLELPDIRGISVSLPLQKEAFSPEKTRIFFEGLLPEGFSRKAVAGWLKTDEDDYLSILEKLGTECLGAIRIYREEEEPVEIEYEPLTMEQVKELAAEGATKSTEMLMETHLSLTGASGKVGLYFDESNEKWYLPKGKAASTHIVKQSHVRLQQIVLNEQLCMLTAKKIGIEVPESFIVDLGHGEEDRVLYATKRYDRLLDFGTQPEGLSCPSRLHQEDFGQALAIPAGKKYEKSNSGYMKKMFQLLNDYVTNPVEDKIKLWDRMVFHYFIGNTDCHVKNFSLLYSEDLKKICLAPAYDIVCTGIYGLTKEMSFFIGGESDISKMSRETFRKAAKEVGLGEKFAMKRFNYIAQNIEDCLETAAEELYESGFEDVMLIKDKIKKLVKEKL